MSNLQSSIQIQVMDGLGLNLVLSLEPERWKFTFPLPLSVRLRVTEKHDVKGLNEKQPGPFYLSGCFSSACGLIVVLVPHGGELAAVVPGITFRNDNIRWKKGVSISYCASPVKSKVAFPRSPPAGFLCGSRAPS